MNIALGIILLPLLSALICGLFGKRLGEKSGWVAAGSMLGAFAITMILYVMYFAGSIPAEGAYVPFSYEWMTIGSVPIEMKFWVDSLTLVMLFVVSFVGSLVFIFANGYMKGDPGFSRFFAYFSLFAASMFTLVMAANFPIMFIGWEGVGLCSYLLIGFYYNKPFDDKISCADAGKKAFVVNRIGDFGFLVAVFFIIANFGTLDFNELFGFNKSLLSDTLQASGGAVGGDITLSLVSGGVITAVALLLFLGATGKSAQIPLYIWLPDAMAGPTPVSALIHAATMVTAGVYMLARCNVFFVLSPTAMTVVAIIGAATAFVAATIAITQTDIKKVLAYSTVSQLGYMFLACGVGAFGPAIFHVFTHAFFKGCLFLGSGSVIHAMHHEQDMMKMGGLRKKMPVTAITFLVSTAAIAGIFPLSGFFSKDEILWKTIAPMVHGPSYLSQNIHEPSALHCYLYAIGLVTALMTAFYMARCYCLTFEGKPRANEKTWSHVHESPAVMTWPLKILAGGAVLIGVLGLPAWLVFPQAMSHFMEPVTKRGEKVYEQFYANTDSPIHADDEEHVYRLPEDTSLPSNIVLVADTSDTLSDNTSTPTHSDSDHSSTDTAHVDHDHHDHAHGGGHLLLEFGLAMMSFLIAIGGVAFGYHMYVRKFPEMPNALTYAFRGAHKFVDNLWYYNAFCMNVIAGGWIVVCRMVLWIDHVIVDGIVNGLGYLSKSIGNELRQWQNSSLPSYAMWILFGANLLALFFLIFILNDTFISK